MSDANMFETLKNIRPEQFKDILSLMQNSDMSNYLKPEMLPHQMEALKNLMTPDMIKSSYEMLEKNPAIIEQLTASKKTPSTESMDIGQPIENSLSPSLDKNIIIGFLKTFKENPQALSFMLQQASMGNLSTRLSPQTLEKLVKLLCTIAIFLFSLHSFLSNKRGVILLFLIVMVLAIKIY